MKIATFKHPNMQTAPVNTLGHPNMKIATFRHPNMQTATINTLGHPNMLTDSVSSFVQHIEMEKNQLTIVAKRKLILVNTRVQKASLPFFLLH